MLPTGAAEAHEILGGVAPGRADVLRTLIEARVAAVGALCAVGLPDDNEEDRAAQVEGERGS